MPLLNDPSARARSQNIKTEIAAGRPVKQAVAIGYSVQRQAAAKQSAKPAGKGKR